MLRRCDVEGCRSLAEQSNGSCMICAAHLCADHVRSELHTCPTYQDDDPTAYYAAYGAAKKRHLEVLLAKVNVEALESAASKARQGLSCQTTALSSPSTRVYLTSSPMRRPKLPCRRRARRWRDMARAHPPRRPPPPTSRLPGERVLERGSNTGVLGQHASAGTARVCLRAGVPGECRGYVVCPDGEACGQAAGLEPGHGGAAGPRHGGAGQRVPGAREAPHPAVWVSRPGNRWPGHSRCLCPGALVRNPGAGVSPFGTLEASYIAIVRHHLRMLASLELGNNLLVDNYLTFLWRLSALPQLVADSTSRAGPFYLKHCDDKGDHILVHDEHNITGIIDWEFSSAEAKELAFSSPPMVWPVRDFYDGSNALAEDEVRFTDIFEQRGRGYLGKMVRGGRPWQRYLFFLGGGNSREMIDLEQLFQGLRKSMPARENNAAAISSYPDWKQVPLAGFAKQDAQLLALLRDERAKGEGSSK
ncbi:hypothetical protein B0T26DRAFT_685239 [Lasiosphaeria miniovina]|uniref:Aminoglycoside phosphotransferase domain-containing protein n=1 Tax=Lasiosphaeria miniovina TaxID=1954250 RepID=A0AA40BG68_9PEZI|nr:uncharacterized protein B0T26DRAFT_685239 [Lasiosphaeria miniovina]KAK0733650.1 hypothetical protein B0T26DRAFT_685239 [Lasiosphaeria miniovina]